MTNLGDSISQSNKALTFLGETLRNEFETLLAEYISGWVTEDYLREEDYRELLSLENIVHQFLLIGENWVAWEKWLTSGFIPEALAIPNQKTETRFSSLSHYGVDRSFEQLQNTESSALLQSYSNSDQLRPTHPQPNLPLTQPTPNPTHPCPSQEGSKKGNQTRRGTEPGGEQEGNQARRGTKPGGEQKGNQIRRRAGEESGSTRFQSPPELTNNPAMRHGGILADAEEFPQDLSSLALGWGNGGKANQETDLYPVAPKQRKHGEQGEEFHHQEPVSSSDLEITPALIPIAEQDSLSMVSSLEQRELREQGRQRKQGEHGEEQTSSFCSEIPQSLAQVKAETKEISSFSTQLKSAMRSRKPHQDSVSTEVTLRQERSQNSTKVKGLKELAQFLESSEQSGDMSISNFNDDSFSNPLTNFSQESSTTESYVLEEEEHHSPSLLNQQVLNSDGEEIISPTEEAILEKPQTIYTNKPQELFKNREQLVTEQSIKLSRNNQSEVPLMPKIVTEQGNASQSLEQFTSRNFTEMPEEIDLEVVLEALTDEINREYRRFYGD